MELYREKSFLGRSDVFEVYINDQYYLSLRAGEHKELNSSLDEGECYIQIYLRGVPRSQKKHFEITKNIRVKCYYNRFFQAISYLTLMFMFYLVSNRSLLKVDGQVLILLSFLFLIITYVLFYRKELIIIKGEQNEEDN
jgi:hypothetical protein